jgi:hypothetical protein
MSKDLRAIVKGFEDRGAQDVRLVMGGKHYKAEFIVPGLGLRKVVNIPCSSPRDEVALRRKAKDMVKRFLAQPEEPSFGW